MTNYKKSWEKVWEIVENAPRPTANNEVFLFGCGRLGETAAGILNDKLKITAFCDNNVSKCGIMRDGLQCILPEQLKKYPNPFVIITVGTQRTEKKIRQQLDTMRIQNCSIDTYVMRKHRQDFEAVFKLLDAKSKEIFAGLFLCRLTGDEKGSMQYSCDNQYFCFPEFRYLYQPNEIFVDCGAYVGDTVECAIKNSVGCFSKIYAFEPNPKAFAAMQKRVSHLRDIWALSDVSIVLEKKGVGYKTQIMSLRNESANLQGVSLVNTIGQESDIVEVISLDEYFSQHPKEKITFIKSDVEGFEWDLLHGAQEIIQRDKPKLAISIYHSIFDFYRIQQYLSEIVPEYQFRIRYHGGNTFWETVLYCCVEWAEENREGK